MATAFNGKLAEYTGQIQHTGMKVEFDFYSPIIVNHGETQAIWLLEPEVKEKESEHDECLRLLEEWCELRPPKRRVGIWEKVVANTTADYIKAHTAAQLRNQALLQALKDKGRIVYDTAAVPVEWTVKVEGSPEPSTHTTP